MLLKRAIQALQTEHPKGLSQAELLVTNEDLLPTAPEKRTWGYINYVSFWVAEGFNLNTFTMSSSLIVMGLSWWQAFICVIIGYSLVAILVVLSARPGTVFNIKFPVVARTSFGIFGSYWPIINRAVMACIWSGVQAWLGGECVYIFLKCIFPSLDNIHNIMSPESQTTSAYVLCYVIYWILMLPTIWVPVHQLRHLFTVKAVVGPVVGFALMGWSIHRGGTGTVFSQPSELSGNELRWTMLRGIAVSFNNMFPLIINAPDFGSPARKPSVAIWPQLITLPTVFIVTSLIGIVLGSSAEAEFHEELWDVTSIMKAMLTNDYSHSTRAGLAIISAGLVYVQLLTNVAANSVAAGCDLTALFPRFFTIRRGGYFSALVAIVICPWVFYTSSSSFLEYLGAFSVFLAAIAGPMLADYYVIRRGHYRIADLFSLDKSGWYWYTLGLNWRAFLGYAVGFAITAPGFAYLVNPSLDVPTGLVHVYDLAWITGTVSSALVYIACCYISPPPGMSARFQEIDESNFDFNFVGAYDYNTRGEAYESMLDGPQELNAKATSVTTDYKPEVALDNYYE